MNPADPAPKRMMKGSSLLAFLKANATIRRKRVASYGRSDEVLWFEEIPKERAECRSPFLIERPDDWGGLWLDVRKKPRPTRPPVPQVVEKWVRAEDLDLPEKEPELLPEITVVVKREVPDAGTSKDIQRQPSTLVEEVAELRRLADHPEVEEAWLQYLVDKWEPWAEETRQWQEVQSVYERLDFMRRRLEEAEERYDLVLAVGLLQWRDSTGTAVSRHVLTGPAELTLDAARGLLTVVPAASFDGFRIELDMLELQDRPQLRKDRYGELLEALDVQAWDTALVVPILHEIANSLRADTQVDVTLQHATRIDETPRLFFAPALVLRERRPTAYEDLIRRFHEAATSGQLETTRPWKLLIGEGEPLSAGADNPIAIAEDVAGCPAEMDRLLFPLPANDEQRQIVWRLQTQPGVLVKGPPGTGKSHTIANLICHLLASGERVLVTAHAPKALAVLRGLLPNGVRDLCVTALGSSRADQRLLEESVRGILRRWNEWPGPLAVQQEIEKIENQLRELENELAAVERELRIIREAETHRHEISGGYSGTAAEIARRLNDQEQEFGWFPEVPADAQFPLDPSENDFLAKLHATLTRDARAELELEVGDAELPDPDEFQKLVRRLEAAESESRRASAGVDKAKLGALEKADTEALRAARQAILRLTDLALRADRVLGGMAQTVFRDALASAHARWARLVAISEDLLSDAKSLRDTIGSARVELPDGIAEHQLMADVERLLAHLEGGGWRGFYVFAPRVIRDTRYIIEECRVDGIRPREVEQLRHLRNHLELHRKIRALQELWGTSLSESQSEVWQAVARTEELAAELKDLLAFFESEQAASLATVLGSNRTELASAGGRSDWLKAMDALLGIRRARNCQCEIQRLIDTVRGLHVGSKAHPCLRSLEEAVQERNIVAWRTAWEERERVRRQKQHLAHYEHLLYQLDQFCPGLKELLHRSEGEETWRQRTRKLREAWNWAAARTWLRRACDSSAYEHRVQDYHRVQRKIEKITETLVCARAWKAFFDRLDEKTVQSLSAWTKAVDRIGKGTGKHAYRHRRTARRYLMDCVPAIPAWIMPLHKLWDSVEAVAGLFDTVIVDEASQAGIDALLLLLLAKRVAVVGDDKQNSPEAVGVLEDDIARLAREHLNEFRFRDEFRPDASLFDHAERTFGCHIALREHFRCVPEIIRFSNDLCYRDAPLIPLRQVAPSDRLPPLRSRFVPDGTCEGEGQRILNRAEAEALVETVVKLVDDEAYEGKTVGVIALQGHAQARVIEHLLAQRLEPSVIEERQLRCGEPATFQGDERDVILLSLVIAPNVRYRSLTRLADHRRFNVAMSRARDQVWLFHSVKAHDLAPDDLRRRLVKYFESPHVLDPLLEDVDRLEREAMGQRRPGTQPDPYESWFEVDVALELLRRRFRLRPQVEVAGYRIDLVVEGLEARLAVECDGDEWHGAEQYERDMARQRQLERAGWTFVRVRESDFYADPQRAVTAVVEACKELGIQPVDFVDGSERERTEAPVPDHGGPRAALEETAVASEDADETVAETEASSVAAGPFTGYSEDLGFPDPREAPVVNIREALFQIINRDGPLTRSSVYRLYVEGCPGLHRVGRTVRRALNRALGAMLRAGEVVQVDELGDGSPEGQVLRVAGAPSVSVRPAGRRDLLEIPPSELLAVLRGFAAKVECGDEEAHFRALLDHYGFKRLTRSRREYLSKVVRRPSGMAPSPGT